MMGIKMHEDDRGMVPEDNEGDSSGVRGIPKLSVSYGGLAQQPWGES